MICRAMIASPDQLVRAHFCWLATWYLVGLWKFVDALERRITLP
jgi:hypothetical protein